MPIQPERRVVFIHGVNIHPKANPLKRLAPAFRDAGFCVLIPTYGYIPAFLVGMFSWLDNRIASTMAGFIEDGDILIGHSNGATLVYLISKQRRLAGAVLINAALEPDLLPNAGFVHTYYNAGDVVSKLSALIPFTVWGTMGVYGYLGPNKSVLNIDQAAPPAGLPALDGHSDVFKAGKARPWSKFMAELCLKSL